MSAIGIPFLFNRYARYKDECSLEFSIKGELEGKDRMTGTQTLQCTAPPDC